MRHRQTARTLLAALLLAAAGLHGEEQNAWPVMVREADDQTGQTKSTEWAASLLFSGRDDNDWRGFRPIYLHHVADGRTSASFLYPFFAWESEPGFRNFSFFQLVNFRREAPSPGQAELRHFDVWPFYFSRETGDPATTYHALLPIGGTIKQRFGRDRIDFTLFPLYLRTERAGKITTHTPWPIVRTITGDGNHGFELWPLFGRSGKAGNYDDQYYLWPLIYRNATHLSDPVPTVKYGFLPFYTRDTGPGLQQENFLWPFFGYTNQTEPNHYHETRYFWPFIVDGFGDERNVHRLAPFYTHSIIKGVDKTWVLWPVWRHATWVDDKVAQEKNQFLFLLYWSQTQRSLTNPNAAPAHKTHFWPLLSIWDNGAGRRQVQFISPFEVLFPTNEPIRHLYTPLVALYRYDRQDPQTVRQSFLWNFITYRKNPSTREFHFGPLFGSLATPERRRVTIGAGLLSWRREPVDGRWKFSLFDFKSKTATVGGQAQTP